MKTTLLLLLLLPITTIAQVNYTVDVLRLKSTADNCDGGAPFCLNAPQDPVFNIWSNDAEANENTYCWIFEDDPAAEYNLWADIQNVQIANESNVLTSYITFDMSGFESDNLTPTCDPSPIGGDDAVMGRQLAQNFDLSTIPEGQPYLTTIDINDTYYAEIEIFWISANAGQGELDPFFAYTIAPNPTEGKFHVHVAEDVDQRFNVTVTDLAGRTIEQLNDVQPYQSIDISNNETGSYLVNIECNGHSKTQTIILK
jgi:hypothetical protein